MWCRPVLPLLLLLAACCALAAGSPYGGVVLQFSGYPGLSCADFHYPMGMGQREGASTSRIVVFLLVVDPHGRIHRTFSCLFDGDISQLQSMATDYSFRIVSRLPSSVSMAIPEADCMVPRPGLPGHVFDVQMKPLAAAHAAPAACLLYPHSGAAPNATAVDAHGPPRGTLLIRFERVFFPPLECRVRGDMWPEVIVRGLVMPPEDHFSCRSHYHLRGVVMATLLRYLSAAYGLPLHAYASDASLPVLTLRPFTCGESDSNVANVDFVVTGSNGPPAVCRFIPSVLHVG